VKLEDFALDIEVNDGCMLEDLLLKDVVDAEDDDVCALEAGDLDREDSTEDGGWADDVTLSVVENDDDDDTLEAISFEVKGLAEEDVEELAVAFTTEEEEEEE